MPDSLWRSLLRSSGPDNNSNALTDLPSASQSVDIARGSGAAKNQNPKKNVRKLKIFFLMHLGLFRSESQARCSFLKLADSRVYHNMFQRHCLRVRATLTNQTVEKSENVRKCRIHSGALCSGPAGPTTTRIHSLVCNRPRKEWILDFEPLRLETKFQKRMCGSSKSIFMMPLGRFLSELLAR